MKKILLILLLVPLLLVGCTNKDEKVYLSDKYYNQGTYIDIVDKDMDKLKNDTYLLFVYNQFCNFKIPCDEIFQKVMNEHKVDVLSMSIDEYKTTSYFNTVRYAPTIIVISKGKVLAYLDANKDEDLDKYQSPDDFEKWLTEHVYLDKK